MAEASTSVAWRPSNHAFAAHAPTAGAGSSTAWQQQSAAAVRSAPKDPWGHAIGASNRVAADASGVHDAGSGGAPGGSGGGGGGRRVGAWRLAQLCAVYAAIAAHLLVMAYTDPLGDPSFVMLLLLFTVQLSLLMAVPLAFFLLTSHGPYIQLGLYHKYMRQHRGFYLSCLLAACAFASAGAYRLALAHAGTPPLLVWRQPGYHALWAAARACLLLFYCAAARAAALSLRPEGEAWLAAAAAAGLGRR